MSNSEKLRTMVLNANFSPISIFPDIYCISARNAIERVLNESATLIIAYDRKVLTPSRDDLYWPSVIANKNNKGFKNEVKLQKATLFYRDHLVCQFCSTPLTLKRMQPNTITEDHVIPVSKGGPRNWENTVAACPSCNNDKGDSLPTGRWTPKNRPYKPTFFQLLAIRKQYPIVVDDPRWVQFLPHFESTIQIRDPDTGELKEYDHEKYVGE